MTCFLDCFSFSWRELFHDSISSAFGSCRKQSSLWFLGCFFKLFIIRFNFSCWLFIIHNRLRVLFHLLFYNFQTQIFIIHFLFNPVIICLFSCLSRLRFWQLLSCCGPAILNHTFSKDSHNTGNFMPYSSRMTLWTRKVFARRGLRFIVLIREDLNRPAD